MTPSGRLEGLRRLALLAVAVAILGAYAWTVTFEPYYLLSWVGYPIVAAGILWRRPRNVIGLLLLLLAACWALVGILWNLAAQERVSPTLELAGTLTGILAFCTLIAIVALFPSGRPSSAVGRVVAVVIPVLATVALAGRVLDPAPLAVTGRANPWGVEGVAGPVTWITSDQGFLLVPLLLAVALGDLAVRWRRSRGPERLQYRWFIWAVALILFVTLSTSFLPERTEASVLDYLAWTVLNALPIAIGVAVTRYGLYEIDRVVSRTVAYAVVTGAVVVTYAVVVTSLTRILPVSSALAVATATLAAAAVFRPVLRRVQAVVDRRFNRERYDAERIVDAFGARLRGATDPDAAAADLVAAVEGALAPAALGVWVPDAKVRR